MKKKRNIWEVILNGFLTAALIYIWAIFPVQVARQAGQQAASHTSFTILRD